MCKSPYVMPIIFLECNQGTINNYNQKLFLCDIFNFVSNRRKFFKVANIFFRGFESIITTFLRINFE